MIEIKKWLKQIITYFKPIKECGTIGMYQRTIVYSLWVLVICFLLSIFLELFKGNNTFLGFVETYAIGIACSDVVVIVTSITQFKSERERMVREYYYSVFELVAYLYVLLECKEEGYLIETHDFSLKIEKTESYIASMFWFDKTKQEKYSKVVGNILRIRINYFKHEKENASKISANFLEKKDVDELTRNADAFFKSVMPDSSTNNLFSFFDKKLKQNISNKEE